MYILHPSIHLTSEANIFAWLQLDIVQQCLFEKNNLGVMSSVVKLMIGFHLTKIHGYDIIKNRRNDLYISSEYFIFIPNNTTLNKIDMMTVFYEMRYIVEYFRFFLPHCVFIGKIREKNIIYISCLNIK